MPGAKGYTIHSCMQLEDFGTPRQHVTVKQAYSTNIVYVMEGRKYIKKEGAGL